MRGKNGPFTEYRVYLCRAAREATGPTPAPVPCQPGRPHSQPQKTAPPKMRQTRPRARTPLLHTRNAHCSGHRSATRWGREPTDRRSALSPRQAAHKPRENISIKNYRVLIRKYTLFTSCAQAQWPRPSLGSSFNAQNPCTGQLTGQTMPSLYARERTGIQCNF